MEKLIEYSHQYRSLDHSLLEFWTNSQGDIPEHKDSIQVLDNKPFYTLSLAIWRNCDAVTLERKYEDAKIVIEFMTETKARIDSMGGNYILNLTSGLCSILAIALGLTLFVLILCRVPGVREVFVLPSKRKEHTD